MAKAKDTFIFYDEWCELLDTLGEHEVFIFMRAVSAYRRGEEYQIDDPAVAMAFRMAKIRMDKNEQSYKDKCDARAEAGAKGGNAKAANANDVANLANVANASFARNEKNVANLANVANVADMKCNEVICSDVKCNDVICNDKELKEKSANADQKKAAASAYSDDPDLNEAIKDFVEHRKKLRKPMTDKAISLFIARLNGMAADTPGKVALINNAIEKGWQTVYPDKEPHQTREPPGQSAEDYLMSVINGEVTI